MKKHLTDYIELPIMFMMSKLCIEFKEARKIEIFQIEKLRWELIFSE